MQHFDLDALASPEETHRAMVILSFLGHGYVFGEKPTIDRIPEVLARPWVAIANQLGRPPILSYESYALDNWQRMDPNGPVAIGNIALLQNFLAGVDEEWFVIIHIDIEARAGRALHAITEGLNAVTSNDAQKLDGAMRALSTSLSEMYATLCRMPEHCDPYVYYNRVRPYIHGWKNHPALTNGLTYEGVKEFNNTGQFFRGETGAQSTIIPCLDAFLGVAHKDDPLRQYLQEMRTYMPPKHVQFLEEIERRSTVRTFVSESNHPQLRQNYTECIEWVEKFRTKHLEYAVAYIAKQNQVDPSNPSHVGTGGTPFVPYLTKHRDETTDHRLSQ